MEMCSCCTLSLEASSNKALGQPETSFWEVSPHKANRSRERRLCRVRECKYTPPQKFLWGASVTVAMVPSYTRVKNMDD